MLDLIGLNLRLLGDSGESHGAVVRWTAEDGFGESGKGDLLVEEDLVLFQELVLADVHSENVVGCQVTAVEGEKKIAQPGVGCLGERVEDWVQEELAEVVD